MIILQKVSSRVAAVPPTAAALYVRVLSTSVYKLRVWHRIYVSVAQLATEPGPLAAVLFRTKNVANYVFHQLCIPSGKTVILVPAKDEPHSVKAHDGTLHCRLKASDLLSLYYTETGGKKAAVYRASFAPTCYTTLVAEMSCKSAVHVTVESKLVSLSVVVVGCMQDSIVRLIIILGSRDQSISPIFKLIRVQCLFWSSARLDLLGMPT